MNKNNIAPVLFGIAVGYVAHRYLIRSRIRNFPKKFFTPEIINSGEPQIRIEYRFLNEQGGSEPFENIIPFYL